MRPRIVVLTLVVAFGVLGLIAVFKGVAEKHAVDSTSGATGTAGGQEPPAATNLPVATVNSGSGTPPAASEQVRQALVEKDLEQVRTLLGEADGTNNPVIIRALLEKMNSPEAEVRAGVLEAFRELNDTNAVPGLLKAVDSIKDPREKVAVLDAIDYIKAPDILAGVNPADFTNNTAALTNFGHIKMNPLFERGGPHRPMAGNNGAQTPPPVAPSSQPQ